MGEWEAWDSFLKAGLWGFVGVPWKGLWGERHNGEMKGNRLEKVTLGRTAP